MAIETPDYHDVFAARADGAAMAEYACGAWTELIRELDEARLLTVARLGLADRYVRARTEWQFLYPSAMRDGPTRTSDSGGEYANQQWSAVAKLSEQLAKLEDALLISPKAAREKRAKRHLARKWTPADEYLDPVETWPE